MRTPPRPSIFKANLLRGTNTTPISCVSSGRFRPIHSTSARPADVQAIHGNGLPPFPPAPPAGGRSTEVDARITRRRKQADLLRQAKEIRAAASKVKSKGQPGGAVARHAGALRKRFWKDVHVKEVNGAYEVHLDARPLRHPTNKTIIRLPLTKTRLAHALALEWDHLMSAQEATKQHLVPLTSLVCRALDIAEDDAQETQGSHAPIRSSIATTVLRYLDTDSLLCWAPPVDARDSPNEKGQSLRDVQEATARPIVEFLTTKVWPGTEIEPVLDEDSIVPRGQKPGVREVVQGWVLQLSHWELAGLERAVLAGKGMLGATRLMVEWSEGDVGLGVEGKRVFDVEEAAKAASLEVDWQTKNWGEVEDTHDVEKEDLRRQLGSVVLLVSGTGAAR